MHNLVHEGTSDRRDAERDLVCAGAGGLPLGVALDAWRSAMNGSSRPRRRRCIRADASFAVRRAARRQRVPCTIACVLSLCELVVGPRGPLCPGLPGDPPLEEMLLYLAQGLLVFCGCLGAVGWIRAGIKRRAPRASQMVRCAILLAGFSVLLMAYPTLMIRERNFGRWADLKRDLSVIEEDAAHYIAMNGPIDDAPKAADFHELERMRGRNLSFTFGPGLPHVDIVYRWWWQRVTIIWGRGRSAAFELDTMTCDAFD